MFYYFVVKTERSLFIRLCEDGRSINEPHLLTFEWKNELDGLGWLDFNYELDNRMKLDQINKLAVIFNSFNAWISRRGFDNEHPGNILLWLNQTTHGYNWDWDEMDSLPTSYQEIMRII
jgi:hypothetical protein